MRFTCSAYGKQLGQSDTLKARPVKSQCVVVFLIAIEKSLQMLCAHDECPVQALRFQRFGEPFASAIALGPMWYRLPPLDAVLTGELLQHVRLENQPTEISNPKFQIPNKFQRPKFQLLTSSDTSGMILA